MKAHRFRLLAIGLLAAFGSVSTAPGWAAPDGYDEGVKAFNSHQYFQALQCFTRSLLVAPNDANVHYYRAMCYQAMNQIPMAKNEYAWVEQMGNTALKAQANAALQRLSASGPAVKPAPSQAAAAPGKLKGRLKIIEFYTNSCVNCKIAAPLWESVSSRLSNRADFKRLDAEDPANAQLVKKYNITNWPTLIWTDDTGAELLNTSMPTSEAVFQRTIDQLTRR